MSDPVERFVEAIQVVTREIDRTHLVESLRKAVEAFAVAVGTADDRPMTDKEIRVFSASLLKRCGL